MNGVKETYYEQRSPVAASTTSSSPACPVKAPYHLDLEL